MRLHFIRHGETDWNAIRRVQGQMESQLTELGRQQAGNLASQLQEHSISHVFCSSSVRTRETSEILFRSKQLPVRYQDDLREIHLGPWEGNYYDDLAHQDPEQFHNFWNQPHQFSLTGAESFEQLQQRGINAVRGIIDLGTDLADSDQKSIDIELAIVSHGALIKSILCYFENRPLARLWEPPKMHNCAHSIVEFDASGQGRIVRYAGIDYRRE